MYQRTSPTRKIIFFHNRDLEAGFSEACSGSDTSCPSSHDNNARFFEAAHCCVIFKTDAVEELKTRRARQVALNKFMAVLLKWRKSHDVY